MTEEERNIQKTGECGSEQLTHGERSLCAVGGRVAMALVLLLGAGSIAVMGWVIVKVVRCLWFSN
jgi:hypothetical protein